MTQSPLNPSQAEFDQVNAYQKIMKTGRPVVVRNYQRRGANQQQNIGKFVYLGRPMIAAKPGAFAGDRTTPGIWMLPNNTTQAQ